MNSSFKRGLFIVTLTGVISISGETAEASDDHVEMSLPGVGIEAVLDDCRAADSDIDVVLILDELMPDDLRAYRAVLDTLSARERICGFIAGRAELMAWERSDAFQLCYDAVPIMGTLDELKALITADDVARAVRIGACNVYHGCAHNMLHGRSADVLRGLLKSAVFTLQAIAFARTGTYERRHAALGEHLTGDDLTLWRACARVKADLDVAHGEFEALSAQLLSWARLHIAINK